MPEMSEKTRQARDKLRESLRANPEYAKAFRETLEEMRKPENVEAAAKSIAAGMRAVQTAIEISNAGKRKTPPEER